MAEPENQLEKEVRRDCVYSSVKNVLVNEMAALSGGNLQVCMISSGRERQIAGKAVRSADEEVWPSVDNVLDLINNFKLEKKSLIRSRFCFVPSSSSLESMTNAELRQLANELENKISLGERRITSFELQNMDKQLQNMDKQLEQLKGRLKKSEASTSVTAAALAQADAKATAKALMEVAADRVARAKAVIVVLKNSM